MGEFLDAYGDWQGYIDRFAETRVASKASLFAARGLFNGFWDVGAECPLCEINWNACRDAFFHIEDAIRDIWGENWGLVYNNLSNDGLHLMPEVFGTDWKAICNAWWEAPLAGWGWTIQLIDFMRKAVWNEPMNIIEQESFRD